MKKFILISILLFLLVLPSTAATNFPYGNFNIKMPPLEEAYPGMGSYYSTLSKGIGSLMWNPALLSYMPTAGAQLSLSGSSKNYTINSNRIIDDVTFEADVIGNFTGAVYFDIPSQATSVSTREIIGHYNYATETTGITYQQAMRINDWLAAGVIYRGPVEGNFDIVGDFPTTVKYELNMSGSSLEGTPLWVDANNRISYSYELPGGTTVTSTSATPVWNGFVTQEASLPLTSYMELRNNVTVNSDITAAIAGKVKNLSFGVNMTPIAGELNIDNAFRTVVNQDATDITVYAPNFDADSSEAIADWFSDPSKYGTSTGYDGNISQTPAGQSIVDAKYRGFYSASAMRIDLGATLDVTKYLRIGLAYENFNGASLNFSGTGRSTYVQTRVGSAEFSNIIDPCQDESPGFFKDTFEPLDGTEDYSLEPTKNFQLPQRMRVGLALVEPIVIAIDYEKQLNPIRYWAADENGDYGIVEISDINMVRVGVDLNVIKGGTTLLLKPTVTGIDAETTNSINRAFKYGALPLKIDLGSTTNLSGWKTDSYVGLNMMSIFDMLQFNTLSSDLSKMLYYGISVTKNFWTIGYLATVDTIGSAAGYYEAKDLDPAKEFNYEDVKWITTWQITYRF